MSALWTDVLEAKNFERYTRITGVGPGHLQTRPSYLHTFAGRVAAPSQAE